MFQPTESDSQLASFIGPHQNLKPALNAPMECFCFFNPVEVCFALVQSMEA